MNKNKYKVSEPAAPSKAKSYENPIKIILILVVLFLYGQTLKYDFVLDDELFIVNNPKVQKGFAGIGDAFTAGSLDHFIGSNFQLYRPIQISLFCIEKEFFGFNAKGFHFVNLVLYCLIALVVYSLIKKLFPKLDQRYQVLIALLFIIHPVHSEVVSNIKSQDELLAALFNLSALLFLFKFQAKTSNFKYLAIAVFCYLLALFSKESSFAFVVIFPMSLYFLNKNSIKESFLKSIPFFVAACFFLICRQAVISGSVTNNETTIIENVLYGAKGWEMILGTKLEIAFYYLKMMLYPSPMTWDYSFNQIPLMTISEFIPLLSLASYIAIALLIVFNLKKRPEIAYGLLFFIVLIVPTANVFFFNGATFAERFLFLPSFGFIVAFVFVLLNLTKMIANEAAPFSNKYLLLFFSVVLVGAGILTSNRVSDWKNNYTVYKSGAANSPNSSRATMGLGTYYMNLAEASTDANQRMAYVDSAVTYIEKSLKIYPENHTASYKLGLIYSILNKKEKSKRYYKQSIRSNPSNVQALNNLGALYASETKFDSAYYYFEKAYKVDAFNDMTLTNIIIASFNSGQNEKAIAYGEEAIKKGLGNSKVYNVLSDAYTKAGNVDKAILYKTQAQIMDK